MESRPQNPEFWNNSGNFHSCMCKLALDHAQLSSGTRGRHFGPSLHLHPFVCASWSSEASLLACTKNS